MMRRARRLWSLTKFVNPYNIVCVPNYFISSVFVCVEDPTKLILLMIWVSGSTMHQEIFTYTTVVFCMNICLSCSFLFPCHELEECWVLRWLDMLQNSVFYAQWPGYELRREKHKSMYFSSNSIKTYDLRHLENESEWITHSDWSIVVNDVLVTAVVLREKLLSTFYLPVL